MIARKGDGDEGASVLRFVRIERGEFLRPGRCVDGLAFAHRHPRESAVEAGPLAQVGQGEGERFALQLGADRRPFGLGEELRTEDEQHGAARNSDVGRIFQPVLVGPGERGRDLCDGLRARELLGLHEAMAGIIFDAQRELQAGLLELGDERHRAAMDHLVVREAVRPVPIDDRAVDAGGLHQGDLRGDEGGVGGVVGPEQRYVMGRQHAFGRVRLVHGPMPAPPSADGFAFEPRHHMDQDERTIGRRSSAGAKQPP